MLFFKQVIALIAVVLVSTSFANADSKYRTDEGLQVVTSFSILNDLAKELGGPYIHITNLVDVDSDGHQYQPKPSDAVAIKNADLVIFNGLGFEGWISRLIQSADFHGEVLEAGHGVNVLVHSEEVDPHAWQSFANIRIYANNITGALISLLPAREPELRALNQRYLAKLESLDQWANKLFEAIPKDRKIVVTSHDAFSYLGREFGIQFLAPVGISTDEEPSASDIRKLIEQIKQYQVKALFLENINNPRLLEQISQETGIAVGGTLFSDALSSKSEPATTYLKMMEHNIQTLYSALNR